MLGSVIGMRCPICTGPDDKVVDSRLAEDGIAIRRRRECLGCGYRFTTFERVEEAALTVQKRSGGRESFDRDKVVRGVQAATKSRPVGENEIERLAAQVEESMRELGPVVPSEKIGFAVLERLRALDEVAYLRFASVYKEFSDLADFEREVGLISKSTSPKA